MILKVITNNIMIALNKEQLAILNDVQLGKNVFMTGPAGTGKTTTISEIVNYAITKRLHYGLTAMTGTAATLINGKTLHSFLGIGLAEESAEALALQVKNFYKKYTTLRKLQLLIIDELSMMSEELFTKISEFLSIIKGSDLPFGGVQLVLSGDFYQLPPVQGMYCFKSPIWDTLNLRSYNLKINYRQQSDPVLQSILQKIRDNSISKEDILELKKCRETIFPSHIQPTRIYALNKHVDRINNQYYKHLLSLYGETEKSYPGEKKPFSLCLHAQVMVTRNINTDAGIVNGTRGRITQLDEDTVWIKTMSNETVPIRIFEVKDDKKKVYFSYMPLCLAYAITVHKAQGVSLDAAEIDLGEDIFEYGQAYTALSRVRSLIGLKVLNIKRKAFKNHPDVVEFYSKQFVLPQE
jgi:ATP-dependent DNA helicase PIF1